MRVTKSRGESKTAAGNLLAGRVLRIEGFGNRDTPGSPSLHLYDDRRFQIGATANRDGLAFIKAGDAGYRDYGGACRYCGSHCGGARGADFFDQCGFEGCALPNSEFYWEGFTPNDSQEHGGTLYWLLPYTSANHLNSMAGFAVISGILISMYGGGFATIPAYAKDVFGPAQVGPIYGRLRTATSTAGILGPILINYSRRHQLAAGVSKEAAYQSILHGLIALLGLGLIANLSVAPVAERFWISSGKQEPAKALTAL
jgi:hypothetical protein